MESNIKEKATEKEILYNKNDIKITKIYAQNHTINNNAIKNKKKYNVEFSIKNPVLLIEKVINFNLINLVYELNKDIYENMELEKISEDQVVVVLLLKHFFEDIGLPQKYARLHIIRSCEKQLVTFKSTTIDSNINKFGFIPECAELLTIEDLDMVCQLVNQHEVSFSLNITFVNNIDIPSFIEKTICVILNKIIMRIKQFIEKM